MRQDAVSYTHLDVYKRQTEVLVPLSDVTAGDELTVHMGTVIPLCLLYTSNILFSMTVSAMYIRVFMRKM